MSRADELARRVAAILEATSRGLAGLGGTGPAVGAILSWLEREDLPPAEVMDVLQRLRASGHLAQLLNLVSHRDLRRYLRVKQVPWPYVLTHWEPSINDSGNFFAGFAVGAAESLTAVLRLLYTLAGSFFSAELAKERDKFWEGVKFLVSDEFFALVRQFAAAPEEYARLGLERFRKDVEDRLWNLEFYEAGRILGAALVAVLTVLRGLAKLPGILASLSKIAARVADLSLAQLKQLGVSLERLKAFLASAALQAATPEGFVFAAAAGSDEVLVLDRAANALGKLSRSKALQQLSGQAPAAARPLAAAVRGFAALSGAARRFLADHGLLRLAQRVLRPGAQHLDEGIAAIEKFHRCQGFGTLAGSWLRGLRGTAQIQRNLAKGANFVMRYCLAELGDLPHWAIVFEVRVSKLFRRFTDVLIPGLKIEFKSVQVLSPKIAKQVARDVIGNLGSDLERLKGLRYVFDRAALKISDRALIDAFKQVLREHPLFAEVPRKGIPAYKKLAEIEAALEKAVVIWPPP